MTTKELKGWIDQKKDMLIVDTMPYEASYKKQHIPGAAQMEFPIPEMALLDKHPGPEQGSHNCILLRFCKCTRSHNGALWARKLGYTCVYRFPGGIKAWDEAEFPVEKVD